MQIFFAATGVSDGDLLRGVRYFAGGATTNSMVMRHQSGTGTFLWLNHVANLPGICQQEHDLAATLIDCLAIQNGRC